MTSDGLPHHQVRQLGPSTCVRAHLEEGYYSTIVIPRDAVAKFPTAVIVRCRDRYGNL